MKQLFTLFYVLLAFQAYSKSYYVSSSLGNDASDGTTISTAWKSISKVNSLSATFNAGDSILFKCGDVFTDMLTITKSGTSSTPIVYSSYGTGSKPLINTAVTVTGWTVTANPKIWVADYTGILSTIRYLTIDGKIQQVGRYPDVTAANDGFLYHDQCWGFNKFRDAALPASTTDWTGATCVVYATPYSINVLPISKHVADTIFLAKNTIYSMYSGYGYFIQNHIKTLTAQGEWYFDTAAKKIYLYSNANPSANKVQASGSKYSISFASGATGVSVDNLSLIHADSILVSVSSGSYLRFTNCSFKYSIFGLRCTTSNNITIHNNSFSDIYNTSILTTAISKYVTVTNNTIKRNSLIPGFGAGGGSSDNNALVVYCTEANIANNVIDSCGYTGIRYEGWANHVHHNEVSKFNLKQFDGGGIYSFGTWSARTGLPNKYGLNVIEYNYIHDGIGYRLGTNSGDGMNRQVGIYCDNLTENNLVRRNVLYNTNGIILNSNTHHHVVDENTIYNSDAFETAHPGIASIWVSPASAFQTVTRNTLFNIANKNDYNPYTGFNVGRSVDTVPPLTDHGNRITRNIVFSSKYSRHLPVSTGYAIVRHPQYFSKLDSNYYWQPFALDTMVATVVDSGFTKTRNIAYGPTEWKKHEPNAVFKLAEIPFTYGTPSTNIFATNTNFASNTTSWSSDAENATSAFYWSATGLDGGTAVLSLTGANTASNKLASVRMFRSIGNVTAGDVYLLKFSTKSNSNSAHLNIYTTTSLSTIKTYKTSTTRTEYSIPITFTATATSQSLYFTLHDKNAIVYLDNISLQKVPITQATPASVMRFEVNTTASNKAINLGTLQYKDVLGNIYTGTINLEPYTSKILMLYTPPITTSTTEAVTNEALSVWPTPNKAKQALQIKLNSTEEVMTTIRIVSTEGKLVFERRMNLLSGPNLLEIQPPLNSGVYIIQSVTENGLISRAKFIQ